MTTESDEMQKLRSELDELRKDFDTHKRHTVESIEVLLTAMKQTADLQRNVIDEVVQRAAALHSEAVITMQEETNENMRSLANELGQLVNHEIDAFSHKIESMFGREPGEAATSIKIN